MAETVMQVLHPPVKRISDSDNANSLVVRLDHGGRVILLPGDLESPGTERLVAADRLPAGGLMMAPHHGSLATDADVILQWARPAETIVSGGRLAERPEVASMLSQRGSQVHVTAISGAIRVRVSARGQIEVRSWLDSPW
jgi:competence protein ComEC